MEHCFSRSKTGHAAIKLVAYYRTLPCFHWKIEFLSMFKHISNNFCGKYCKDKQSLISS